MAFAGVFSRDDAALAEADRMLRMVARAQPRSWRRWRGAGVAVAVSDDTLLATAPEGLVAIVDGQIHNRRELVAYAGCAPDTDDARLLLAAFTRAGDTLPDRVVGDCAFAIWDDRHRQLRLSVDPGGYRPLLFAETADALLIASEARALMADADVAPVIDDTGIAEWIALLAPSDPTRTLYRDVRRVPPGHAGLWTPDGIRISRWWRPEALPELRLARHEDYVAAVRAALDAAVHCRIGSEDGTRVGAHLSGGLDSGVITALAAERLGEGGRQLTAFTAAPDKAFRLPPTVFGDEWPHAAAVAARYPNITHVRIANDTVSLRDLLDQREGGQDVPLFNLHNSAWSTAIEQDAAARGISVLLTGEAGNMTFSYSGALLLPQLFADHCWRQGVAAWQAARRAQRWPWKRAAIALGDAAIPWWMGLARTVARRGGASPDAYSLIDREFAARSGVAARWRTEAGDPQTVHRGDSRALRLAVLERNPVQGDFAAATRRLHGIDTRDPTRDRRVVELCLTIPEDQFQHRGTPRAIARGIAAGLLPAGVTHELRRGRQSSDWAYAIEAALPDIAADAASLCAIPAIAERIDVDRIERAVARWPGAAHVTDTDSIEWTAVTRAIATGRFVRRIERHNG